MLNKTDLQKFSNFVIFQTKTGKINIDVFFHNETLWLTQEKMADLFEKDRTVITRHLKNIFNEGELEEDSVCANFAHTAEDGKTYNTKYYNLRAITGKTAAEIIYTEADANKIFMGLKTWRHAPDGKILKSDVTIAKNYLNEQHLKELERIVSAYLDLAENRAKRGVVMNMKDWALFLDKFLQLSDYPILLDKGKISSLEATIKAEDEYEKFRIIQDKNYISDFDREIKKMLDKKNDH